MLVNYINHPSIASKLNAFSYYLQYARYGKYNQLVFIRGL